MTKLRKAAAAAILGAALGFVPAVAAIADVTIEAENHSDRSDARSGDATATNTGSSTAGPSSGSGPVVQDGDNQATTRQRAGASSGDAMAGSQAAGVAGTGNVTVRARNRSDRADADSGSATAANLGGSFAGPSSGGGPVVQDGDNEATLEQDATADTGDAVSGSQVLGVALGA